MIFASETGAKSIAVSLSLLTNSFLAPEASNFKQHSFLLNIAANIKRVNPCPSR